MMVSPDFGEIGILFARASFIVLQVSVRGQGHYANLIDASDQSLGNICYDLHLLAQSPKQLLCQGGSKSAGDCEAAMPEKSQPFRGDFIRRLAREGLPRQPGLSNKVPSSTFPLSFEF